MPAPQWTPPGHLDWHVVLVAVTPAMLALAAGAAVAIVGGGRAARTLGWIAMAGAFALLAAFLRPQGVAQAYSSAVAHGWLRVGPVQTIAALAAGAWTAWWWRPGLRDHARGWGARTAAAILLPLTLMPLLALACEPDLRVDSPDAARWRPLRLGVVLLAAAAACWLVPTLGADRLWARLPMAAACAMVAISARGAWSLPAAAACIAALAPLASG